MDFAKKYYPALPFGQGDTGNHGFDEDTWLLE
jgi:hypothetical protein